MKFNRLVAAVSVSAATTALLLCAGGVASAATPTPANFSQGAVNIDLTITNNSGAPMTLQWDGLTGTDDHWDQQPQQVLAKGASEEVTGYSHVLTDPLSMAINYTTASGDLAAFDVQAQQWTDNGTTGTEVTQSNGLPATDLSIAASVSLPAGVWDHAVATATIGPAS
ncbi:hypothetical protein [Nakamurella endophytica]|uniref:Uncharacterized protein n=1 Tax=Nakamurella endophytica TaxID=1748367 RepID=A0A917SSZ9_9ACTN|nr:hypothetical protein [Nakamurella endophytica]GGL97492.1 hypothetical protein GCM10011594_16650 [Nakamurella endophytica]